MSLLIVINSKKKIKVTKHYLVNNAIMVSELCKNKYQ